MTGLRRFEIEFHGGRKIYVYGDTIAVFPNDYVINTREAGGFDRHVAVFSKSDVEHITEVAAMVVIPKLIQEKDKAAQERLEQQ